eukprot:TRINITY_DN14415_c0_g1_i1.p1 TRINITY_DN14415_c0_g1~~TRINITY_DN14415_c0_g1_i1.p1  ORF type:complete len:377 (+),score=138.48 TRINITY_DN14415_c0_g1_i1:64-1131(+)
MAEGGAALPPPVLLTAPSHDNVGITATNDSATVTKMGAVRLGYYDDPYALRLGELSAPQPRAPPMIHRGYFARVRFVEHALEAFAKRHPEGFQVVSLGAGFDSTYFRVVGMQGREGANAVHAAIAQGVRKWIDMDFTEVIARKHAKIAQDDEMAKLAAEGNRYALIGVDLREPDIKGKLQEGLQSVGAASGLPTIVLSECVLVYLAPAQGDAVIQAVGDLFSTAAFVTYEQVHPDTPFGQRMVENLVARGCPLLSLHAYPTLAAQEARYQSRGFPHAACKTMNAVWDALPVPEKQKAQRVEFMDELEEWTLIHNHYCFTCASKGVDPGWCEEVFAKAPMVLPVVGGGMRSLPCAD